MSIHHFQLWYPGFRSSRMGSKRSYSRRPRTTRCHRLRLELLEGRILPSQVTWINPQGGDWDTASNWNTQSVPGPADDVIINIPGITVTMRSNLETLSTASPAPIRSTFREAPFQLPVIRPLAT